MSLITKIKGGAICIKSTVKVNGKEITLATWNLTGDREALLKEHASNLSNAETLHKGWNVTLRED